MFEREINLVKLESDGVYIWKMIAFFFIFRNVLQVRGQQLG